MRRVCLLVHSLVPEEANDAPAPTCWSRARAHVSAGDAVDVLHTEPVPEAARHALRHTARSLGATYRHLEEFPAFTSLPVQPAVPAHRRGLDVAQAVAALGPDVIWVLDDPAQAAALAASRIAGLCPRPFELGVSVTAVAPWRRERAGEWPQAGRVDIATDFLERQTLAAADRVMVGSEELLAWLRRDQWPLPRHVACWPAPDRAGPAPAVAALAPLPRSSAPTDAGRSPTIAVCMPYYEQPEHLLAALTGIADQRIPPDEVIVVDDGSPSVAAAAAFDSAARLFARPGWTFLRQPNAGPAAARNRAAAAAVSQALLFCDADNRFRPEMTAVLGRALACSGANAVSCGFTAYRPDRAADQPDDSYVFLPLGPCEELGWVENSFGDTNFIVRRTDFLAAGGFPVDNRAASEDWEFLLRWVRAGRTLAVAPALLFYYRLDAASHARRHREAESARAAVGPALAGLDPGWRRLWPHLAGLVRAPRVPQLEAELAAQRLAAAQQERRLRQQDRMRRAHIALVEHAVGRHKDDLLRAQAVATDLRRKVSDLTESTSRRIAALERTLGRREEKIARMQRSWSWRVTAPFRAVRRAWLDQRTSAPPDETPRVAARRHFRHHLDAPRTWSRHGAEVAVRGWCFAEEPGPLKAVRARIGARSYDGVYGSARPDLLLVFPQWEQCALAGFKIDVVTLPGDDTVTLEVRGEEGPWEDFLTLPLSPAAAAATPGSYEHWIHAFDQLSASDRAALQIAAEAMAERPVISILMPVYNTDQRWLAKAISSVRDQVYPWWELCIADDASSAGHVRPFLEKAAKADPRIKWVARPTNGHISATTNSALALATGRFTALFDHDDELAPHALYCVAQEIAAFPDAQVIYSDEDKIDEQGVRFDPHFKPDWNPDLLHGQNYLSHLTVYRTDLLRSLGGLRPGLEGAQDWDLALRATDQVPVAAIRHIPRILYHWRANDGSTALHLGEKNYVDQAARQALQDHFARRGVAVEITPAVGRHWRVRYPLPRQRPLVSIVIPTRNAAALVRICVASLFARTNYAPLEILLIDNRSDDPEALAYFAELAAEDGVRVLTYDAPFNYSALNNFAVPHARGDILCLLNNDIEVLEPQWLDEMVSHALRPEIGAVGARLYYPDTRIQHAGVITGLGGVAGHAFKHFAAKEPGTPQFRPHLVQNLSVVTAACLVIRRETYLAVGGFDEAALTIAFNDVDFCLKVEALGLRNLYTPFAELVHHESATRGREDSPEKIRRFQAEVAAIKLRWGVRLLRDPAYNPNLTLDSEDFALAYPPRTPALVPPAAAEVAPAPG